MTFDLAITQFVQAWRPEWFVDAMRAVAWAGSTAGYLVVAPLVGGIMLWRGRKRLALATLLVTVGNLMHPLIKVLVQRPRPGADEIAILQAAEGFSFPSGHAFGAVAFYGFLVYLALAYRVRHRSVIVAALVGVIMLIGFASVYLGRHWMTDVLGGWLLGGLWLAVYIPLVRGWISPKKSIIIPEQ
jgi:undecaprenyl-diphosphatase